MEGMEAMSILVSEEMVRAHLDDLRRDAARYGRAVSRADRARHPRPARRLLAFVSHRRPVAVGCQA